MSLLRNIVSDLIDKRLWPVAVLLLVALFAVPFVVAGSGDEEPVSTAQIPTAIGEGDVATAVTPAETTGSRRTTLPENDPFREAQQKKSDAPTGGASTGGTPTGGAGGDTGTGSTGGAPSGGTGSSDTGLDDVGVVPVGGDDGGGSGSGGGSTTSTDKDAWRVDLRFGKDGQLSAKTNVARLSPLPSQTDPFFIFLGVQADGKTALFLVSSDATATGDGSCKPTPANCDRVELEEGQTEFFDVVTPEGTTVQYQLDLVNVERETKASAAAADAARARESKAGRTALRKAVKTGQVEVADLAYSTELGLVVPSGAAAASVKGSLFGGYRVDLRFGAPGELVKRYNLARLTPLPSVDDPSFVYLGVLDDGATALFLNPSRAVAAGDAVCEPTPEQCDRVKLTEGQRATFAAPTLDGATTDYELQIDGIAPVEAASEQEAAASRTRESPAGRVILRRLITEVGTLVQGLTFSGDAGVLEQEPPAPAAPAAEAPADAPADAPAAAPAG